MNTTIALDSTMTPAGNMATDVTPAWHFDHINVSMGASHALRTLFEGVMGLQPGYRPPFPFPGLWLYAGDQATVHAVNEQSLSAEAGELRFNHIAFRSDHLASEVITRLQRSTLSFKVARVPDENIAQIFVELPGNFVVELCVPDDSTVPSDHTYSAKQGAPTADDF